MSDELRDEPHTPPAEADLRMLQDEAEWADAHGIKEFVTPKAVLRLVAEVRRLRAKSSELHHRAQAAEAAAADAGRCMKAMARNGNPWVAGSLGRAFLAYDNSLLCKRIAELETENAKLREGNQSFLAFVESVLALEPHMNKRQPITEALLDKVKELQALRAENAWLHEQLPSDEADDMRHRGVWGPD